LLGVGAAHVLFLGPEEFLPVVEAKWRCDEHDFSPSARRNVLLN